MGQTKRDVFVKKSLVVLGVLLCAAPHIGVGAQGATPHRAAHVARAAPPAAYLSRPAVPPEITAWIRQAASEPPSPPISVSQYLGKPAAETRVLPRAAAAPQLSAYAAVPPAAGPVTEVAEPSPQAHVATPEQMVVTPANPSVVARTIARSVPSKPLVVGSVAPVPGVAAVPADPLDPTLRPLVKINLEQALRMAVDRNLDLASGGYDAAIAQSRVMLEQGAFDPQLQLQLSALNYQRGFRTVFGTGTAQSNVPQSSAGLTWLSGNGTTYAVQYDNGSVAGVGNNFAVLTTQPSTLFSVAYPLMKGHGAAVVQSRLNIARNNRDEAALAYQQQALDIGAAAERAYWALVLARKMVEMRRDAMVEGYSLQKMVKDRVRLGKVAEYQLSATRQQLARLESQVFAAERDERLAEQGLQRLLRLSIASTHVEPQEALTYEPGQVQLVSTSDRVAVVDRALKNRPELRVAELQVASSDIQAKADYNATKPTLNLVGDYRLANDTSNVQLLYKYRVGVVFQMPIGNHAALGAWQASRLKAEQARARLENVRQAVIQQVSDALATVEANREVVERARQAREAAESTLAAEQERFGAGLGTLDTVMASQQVTAEAQQRELIALSDYYAAETMLHRACGDNLTRYGIAVAPRIPAHVGPSTTSQSD